MRKILLGAVVTILALSAHAAPPADCPPWPQAERNLKLHGYNITALSRSGVERALAYLAEETKGHLPGSVPEGWKGYYASTTFYFLVSNGQRAGGVPSNRALIVLTEASGECLAQLGGTIQQMQAVLDGSAARLTNSLAR